jgi:sec-independent protein translocase protein TatC
MIKRHSSEVSFRLFYTLFANLLASCTAYVYVPQILFLIAKPLENTSLLDQQRPFIYTHLTEAFAAHVHVSIYVGLLITLPYIAFNIIAFLKPGLYQFEYSFLKFGICSSIFIMVASILVSYNYLFPWFCDFFLNFEMRSNESWQVSLQYSGKIYEYVTFVFQVFLLFALSLQIPFYLHVLGVWLERRLFIVAAFILAALISPPDVLSQLSIALPLVILNEFSLFCQKFTQALITVRN